MATIPANDRAFFSKGVNMYVPKMTYAADMLHGEPAQFSLGTPAVATDTAIASAVVANAVATTIEAQTYVSDARYGRSLTMTISGNPGNAHAIDVVGEDYLGQPVMETFTGANGVTAVIYGKKAFYRVLKTVIRTAASNAVTAKIGTGSRLGIPYKSDIAWAKEGNVFVSVQKRDFLLSVSRPAALAVAGGSVWVKSPAPGFIKNLTGYPFGSGSTNDPVITTKLGGTAITGLTITIDTSDTTGLNVTGVPTTAGYNANNRLVAGSMIEIPGAAAASATGDNVGVTITPTQFLLADTTDPQTRTTGDPRGTYESIATLDGATEIIVGLDGDPSYNAAGNGGLHGIRHVAS